MILATNEKDIRGAFESLGIAEQSHEASPFGPCFMVYTEGKYSIQGLSLDKSWIVSSVFAKGTEALNLLMVLCDSSDQEVLSRSGHMIRCLCNNFFKGVESVFVATHQDSPSAFSPADLVDILMLDRINSHRWTVAGVHNADIREIASKMGCFS